ncbi:something about silencing protein 10 isoform X1 [Dendrobium catenatum]|uniref:something about silencing protein 10 isoform X1 n=1 Tax=Dendrobium catenatum TaxID=906689 RepID=UPI00109F179D|nr:something about silencing protein 10 isoform X1 [Dendrobium catenatum]
MGKRSNKRRRFPKPGKAHAQEDDAYMEKEVDDEIDAFHKQREMIPLDVNEDAGDSDDDLEEPVFDLEGYQNGDSYNGREDDDGEDEDEDDKDNRDFDDLEDKGFAAKIARQAKYLREKFGGGEDEMSDDDEQDEERKAVWGSKKNLYYSADNIDYELQSSDEDLPMEEEAEVLKIQREKAKTLEMEDFGLEASDREDSDFDGDEKTFQDLSKVRVTQKPGVEVIDDLTIDDYEEIKKDLSALSKAEQMDVVYSSAPELVSLLSELNTSVDQLQQVKPLACKLVREGKDQARGMDYLELKQIVLLTYCQAISFYLLLKSEGHPVRDHPVIARLVEIKNLWEKMKQISLKFPPQEGDGGNHTYESMNKLNGQDASLELKPNMLDISAKALVVSEMTGSLKDSAMDVDSKSAKKIQNSQLDLKSIEMMKIRENLEAKLKQKGIYGHVQGKVDKTLKDLVKPLSRSHVTTNDYDDVVACTKQHDPDDSHQVLNKLAQTALTKAKGWKVVSGDGDLPKRDDIAERRRKHELRVLARARVISTDDGDEGYDNPGINTVGADFQENEELESEDEFYRKVKTQRVEKLNAKSELYSRAHAIPMVEPEADGKRQITRQMEKNRGLTRNRKKLTKNPRKKYKIKHQKAVIRRKGQIRDIRKPSGPYGGESTGINTNVSRSIRFKS